MTPARPPLAASARSRSSDRPVPDTAARLTWLATTGAVLASGEREGHPVAVPLQVAQGGLDQAQRLLRGAVEVPVAVGRDVLDDDVDPAGGGAGEVEPERLWLPGVDALPVHPVGDVRVAVDDNGRRACAHWTCLAWAAGTRPGRTPAR
jgi:hypothetical protein